jgi:hypothetical protein
MIRGLGRRPGARSRPGHGLRRKTAIRFLINAVQGSAPAADRAISMSRSTVFSTFP